MKKLLFATKIIAKNTNILPKKMKIAIAMMNSDSRKQKGYFSMYISVSKDYILLSKNVENQTHQLTLFSLLITSAKFQNFCDYTSVKEKKDFFFIFILN